MKRRWKLLIALPLVAAALLAIGGFIYVKFFFKLDLFPSGPIHAVTSEGWAKLKVGMTREEVINLLGDSQSKCIAGTMEMNGKKYKTPEYWAYNWSDGLEIFGPSDKAYVVYFDDSGRVTSFREPLRQDVPKGVEHKPSSADGYKALLIEPEGVHNTGSVRSLLAIDKVKWV